MKFHVHSLTRKKFTHTTLWAFICTIVITICISGIARTVHNFRAALTDKPNVAVYVLLPELEIGKTTVLRESDTERDYLAETNQGDMMIRLKKGEKEWYVALKEKLHR